MTKPLVHIELKERMVKTFVWYVKTPDDEYLGEIKWKNSWRQYAFFPEWDSYFNHDCMMVIATFISDCNLKHKVKDD